MKTSPKTDSRNGCKSGSKAKPPARRGRPPGSRKDVPDNLLQAAQVQLQKKSHLAITSNDIAEAAGTNVAMINYYFNNKDGLFAEIVDNRSAAARRLLEYIESRVKDNASGALQEFADLVVGSTFKDSEILALCFIEVLRPDSRIRQLNSDHSKLRGWDLMARVEQVMSAISAKSAGPKRDPMLLAWVLMSLAYGSVILRAMWEAKSGTTRKPDVKEWSAVVAEIMQGFLTGQ